MSKLVKKEKTSEKKENKYEKLTNKKRKLSGSEETDKENKKIINENPESKENKKPFKKLPKKDFENIDTENGENNNKKSKLNKTIKSKGSIGEKAKFKNGKNGKINSKKTKSIPSNPVERKDLLKKRKQKKLAENYDLTINMKKIWETLRKSETTEETKKKLCLSLYEQVKSRIKQMSFAHDTVRVIECLVQYGTEKIREGVFEELKNDLVDMSKEKYARFLLRKMLTYTKEQKESIVQAFSGRVVKLIKHSFACQIVESLFNEHANNAQRNQMLMEFYDPTFALLHNQKCKSLSEVLEAQKYSTETILNNIKETLITCIDKTILMFSLIHRVFLEFLQNCDQKQKTEIIELLSENLVHMIHTKDGASVAMQCIWNSTAKDRKKIIKSMKSFIVKMALEEHGHIVLLAILDSVDDTKLVSKGILDELFRSINVVVENDYGRKVLAYIIAPRDSRFFIKDYVKRLEQGDSSETSKKDPEKRRTELFDYSKSTLLEYFKKTKINILYNGGFGILLPIFLEKLGKEGDDFTKHLADAILENPYEPIEKNSDQKAHCVEEAASHLIIKKLLATSQGKEKKSLLSLSSAILEHKNSNNVTSWIECNRGCFILVNLFESSNDDHKKKVKQLLKDHEKDLKKTTFQGAKLLLEKIKQI